MTLPRFIAQPGSSSSERILAVEGRLHSFPLVAEAGVLLLEAIRRGFAAEGFTSGIVELADVGLSPFAYVMPALSETPKHAAFYSTTFRPEGISRVKTGALTFGTRDDSPFFHCHALWLEADGKVSGGHILPEETVIAETVTVQAFGLCGAGFQGKADPETNFKLFEPVASGSSGRTAGSRAYAIRLRPNQDYAAALERFCAERGITSARVIGGVGSTIGAIFSDGRMVENFATEIYLRKGIVRQDHVGSPVAELDISLVDYTGAVAEGRLKHGDNPVLMTIELVLEEL